LHIAQLEQPSVFVAGSRGARLNTRPLMALIQAFFMIEHMSLAVRSLPHPCTGLEGNDRTQRRTDTSHVVHSGSTLLYGPSPRAIRRTEPTLLCGGVPAESWHRTNEPWLWNACILPRSCERGSAQAPSQTPGGRPRCCTTFAAIIPALKFRNQHYPPI
jgi:hypothetical protein